MIVSGDLTWHGTAPEFDYTREFLSRLRSAWSLEWSQFVVVPGNHDITWIRGDAATGGQPAGPEAEAAYRRFFGQALRFPAPDQLCLGRRYLLGNFVPVDVVAVNSCRLEREAYRGFGFVGLDQLRLAFDAMGWTKGSEAGPKVRVLVLHHHVVPVVPREDLGAPSYSLTLDAGELLYTALEYGVDLVVHGHQHKPFIAGFSRYVGNNDIQRERSLTIHGAGSIGVATGHLQPGIGNAYSILRFDHRSLELSIRERSPEHGSAFREAWSAVLGRAAHGFRPGALA